MFIRIVTGIRIHFEARVTEWLMSITLVTYGIGLVGAGDAWSDPDAWAGMTFWMGEEAWGWNCIGLGTARLFALAVNGTFAHTAYSKYSPHVRGVGAVFGAVFWFMVLLSISAGSASEIGIYQLPLVLDLWCVFHAWRDTGRLQAARNGVS